MYWVLVYNILVFWVFLIHVTNFIIFTIQYDIKENSKEDNQETVKNMREGRIFKNLRENRISRKSEKQKKRGR